MKTASCERYTLPDDLRPRQRCLDNAKHNWQAMASRHSEAVAAMKMAPAYRPLPPGAVRPTGRLLDWAKAARDGRTGHLDERAAAFGKDWSGEDFEARGARDQGTGEPLEQCAYWFDGLVRLAYALQDDLLIHIVRTRLDAVVQGVLEGGPSLIYWRPKNQVNRAFENWGAARA